MSLTTFSKFYYGHRVTADAYTIDFNEGGPDFTAEVPVGKYSLTEFVIALKNALNVAGTLTYNVSVDRDTRLITISASGTFSLLVATGPTLGVSLFSLVGFSGADRTGAATYTGDLPSGSEYSPQFILQNHIPKENFKKAVQASVNESADGTVEVVRFADVRFVQFDIQYITDVEMDNVTILNNPTGVSDANDFMNYITEIGPIEFIPDRDDTSTFDKIQLDSTPENKDGTEYTLKEWYDRELPGLFSTGILKFRVLN